MLGLKTAIIHSPWFNNQTYEYAKEIFKRTFSGAFWNAAVVGYSAEDHPLVDGWRRIAVVMEHI